MRWITLGWLSLILPSSSTVRAQSLRDLVLDYRQQGDSLSPIWAFFEYDEPNYTYQPDGKKLLSELAALSSTPVYVLYTAGHASFGGNKFYAGGVIHPSASLPSSLEAGCVL